MSREKNRSFVHLHTHSDYSKLDGVQKLAKTMQKAIDDDQPAIAFTEHGTMAHIADFMMLAERMGIKPIPAIEIYHVPDYEKAKARKGSKLSESDGDKSRYHMILLAYNQTGYQNLLKIHSISATQQFYYKPLVDNKLLEQYHEGLIATTGCLSSQVSRLLLDDRYDDALEVAEYQRNLFGSENYYVEIQNHQIADQLDILPMQQQLAKDLGVSLLATNDSHFLDEEDHLAHDVILAMQTGSTLDDEDRFSFDGHGHHFKTAEEMWELFPEDEYPNACNATLEIAERVEEIKLSDGSFKIPHFILPENVDMTEGEYLREKAFEGATQRWGIDGRLPKKYADQIDHELTVIENLGFSGYILFVAYDIIGFCKENGIWTGPGRGSAAGSAVNYAVGITEIDPFVFGCRFERFLNPDRKSMPDIDVDIESGRQPEVFEHIANRYGRDRVTLINTVGSQKGKSVLKNVARVMGYPVSVGTELSAAWREIDITRDYPIEVAVRDTCPSEKENEDLYHHWRANAALRSLYPKYRDVIDVAMKLQGVTRTYGQHPAGILVTPTQAMDYVPLRLDKDGNLVSEFDKNQVEDIGLVKMDALSIKELNISHRVIDLIAQGTGQNVDINQIPLDDRKTFDLLSSGDVAGVFQLGTSAGMGELTTRVKPDRVEDIAAIVALYRPGPMGQELHHRYADAKNNKVKIDLPHPDMWQFLESTYGGIVYQEQLTDIVQHFAGYTAAEADNFRRAVGKKDAVRLAAEEGPFKEGVLANDYSQKVADALWNIIPPFAQYAFNLAHAAAYGMLAYQTAYLKANYPAEFLAAQIEHRRDKAPALVETARSRGVQVFAPSVNHSDFDCRTAENTIWLGISGITGVGTKSVQKLLQNRIDAAYEDVVDFAARSGMTKNQIVSLIHAGALDDLHDSRKAMVDQIEEIVIRGQAIRNAKSANDESLDLFEAFDVEVDTGSNLDNLDLDASDYSISDKMAFESQALGFIAGKHPMAMIRPMLENLQKTGTIPNDAVEVNEDYIREHEGSSVTIFGTIRSIETAKGRSTRTFMHVENERGESQRVMFFGTPLYDATSGSFVVVTGNVRYYDSGGEEHYDIVASEDALTVRKLDALLSAESSDPSSESAQSASRANQRTYRARRSEKRSESVTATTDEVDVEEVQRKLRARTRDTNAEVREVTLLVRTPGQFENLKMELDNHRSASGSYRIHVKLRGVLYRHEGETGYGFTKDSLDAMLSQIGARIIEQ